MDVIKLLEHIKENQNRIQSYGKFNEDTLKKINYKFRLDWNYYSNRMEGGTLTREETRSVMVGNISVEGKPIKDVMEMNGHDRVVLDVLKMGKGELRLSEKRIKTIHKAIMHEEDPKKAKQIGQWKTAPNEIINYKGEKILFTSPSEVPEKMHVLIDKTNAQLDSFFTDKKNKRHPVLIAADFHLSYVSIHPFYDGNGRTARIFTNLLLISSGFPVIIIKDEHKDRYYSLLADIQAYGGDEALFHEFIAERIVDSQKIILDALEGREIEDTDDLDKRITLLKKKISGNDKVMERKSFKIIYSILSEIAFPLFKELENKLEKLNEFFFEYGSTGSFSLNNHSLFTIKSKTTSWDTVKETWLNTQFLTEQVDLKSFRFEYGLNGFKKSIHAQSVSESLTFWFDDYNYIILSGWETRDQGLKKSYSDKLTSDEKNILIKKVLDPVLDRIEHYMESK